MKCDYSNRVLLKGIKIGQPKDQYFYYTSKLQSLSIRIQDAKVKNIILETLKSTHPDNTELHNENIKDAREAGIARLDELGEIFQGICSNMALKTRDLNYLLREDKCTTSASAQSLSLSSLVDLLGIAALQIRQSFDTAMYAQVQKYLDDAAQTEKDEEIISALKALQKNYQLYLLPPKYIKNAIAIARYYNQT